MRNSDKLLRLARRKASLVNAVVNDLPQEQVVKRAERVRQAVLTALKKHRVRVTPYEDMERSRDVTERTRACEALEDRWRSMPIEDVIEKSCQWPEHPRLKDLGLT